MQKIPKPFEPKKEASIRPFDPNIRHRMDDVSNDLIYRGLE
jgi:hypothetical protein